jgi:apolipoprotein N-acyltransferase
VLLTGASDDAGGRAAGAAAAAAETAAAGPPAAAAGRGPAGSAGTAGSARMAPGGPAVPASGSRTGQPAAGRRLRTRLALATALTGGVALAAAFPPVGIWPLAAAGPALLVVALWQRSLRGSLAVGLVFGLGFFFPLLSWLVNVAWYAWAALAIVEAMIFAVLAVAQRLLLRLRAWPVAVAGWWVAAEALRGRWPYAFPWGRLAMSQAGAPTARWAAIGGAPLLTFVVALAGTCLAWLLLEPPRGRAAAAGHRAARPGLAFVAAAGLALAGPLLPVDQGVPGGPAATVAAVQGNVPHAHNLPNLFRAATVTQNHAAATRALAAQVRAGTRAAPDVVIWPENSTDLDPGLNPAIYGTIQAAVDAINRPVLVGAVLQHPVRNAGQLWLPRRGPVAVYIKRQLVPFGEYIPFRGLLSHITSLTALQPVNFTPGHRAVVFRLGKIRLGDVICYEVGFDGLVSSEVRGGANLLVVQSNDADFELDGQPGESEQQIAMARIRAIESNRAVVYASTTGESAIIAPDGSIIAHSGIWRRAVLDARVPLRSSLTLADRVGSWPEYVLTVLVLAGLAWAIAGPAGPRTRSRRDAGPASR